jgi:hypothetical protein
MILELFTGMSRPPHYHKLKTQSFYSRSGGCGFQLNDLPESEEIKGLK